MKIAIDYGGGIADTNLMKSKWIEDNLRIQIPVWQTDRTTCIKKLSVYLGEQEAHEIYNTHLMYICHNREPDEVPLVDGCKEGLEQLVKRHKISLITARTSQLVQNTYDVLEHNDLLQYVQSIYSCRMEDPIHNRILTKGEICETYGMHVIIEDDERHLLQIDSKKIMKILFKNKSPNMPNVQETIAVSSWNQLLKYIGD